MRPSQLTAAAAATEIREGRLSSEALVGDCLDTIARIDGAVRAFAWVDPEQALEAARRRDAEPARGPLHGVPVAIKDMIDTADLPTQHNSPIYAGHRPARDAACVRTLRALGAVILGKTDTHEFAAAGRLPATRNPHDLACTAGGSSSGSAAAVAAYMVPLALGTQTGGSTIRPAAFCGIAGMKPTWAEVSFEGAKGFSPSLDTLGWMARSVADLGLLALALGVGRGSWVARTTVAGMNLAVCRTPMWAELEPDAASHFDQSVARLAAAGARVVDLELPGEFADLNAWHDVVMQGEGRASFRDLYLAHPELLHEEFKAKVENHLGIEPLQLARARDIIASLRPVFDRLAGPFDAVLTPSAPGQAPRDLTTTGMATFSRSWTALHVPCITLPAGRGDRGLPLGLQLVGPRFADLSLLGAAAAIETVLSGPAG
ncbi:MAG: amidase [Steroidobacteraceae bacterium]